MISLDEHSFSVTVIPVVNDSQGLRVGSYSDSFIPFLFVDSFGSLIPLNAINISGEPQVQAVRHLFSSAPASVLSVDPSALSHDYFLSVSSSLVPAYCVALFPRYQQTNTILQKLDELSNSFSSLLGRFK